LGQEFFVQYRVRYDAAVLTDSTWQGCPGSGGCGFKQNIIREEDHFVSGSEVVTNACAGDSLSQFGNGIDEIVLQQIDPTQPNNHYHPFIYSGCPSGNNDSFVSITNPQTGDFVQIDQGAAGCFHGNGSLATDGGWTAAEPPTGNCFDYHANDWMTFQVHVVVGPTWGVGGSKVEVWAAHDGQPSQLIINLSDWLLNNNGSTTGNYGKLWNDLFNTAATGVQSGVNPHVNYDNAIIAKRRIPDPDVSTPNPPDSLALVDLTPSCTGSACQVQINWRVNSQNHTAQDDEGFLVERCTANSAVGSNQDWVCFANQNNSNSGPRFGQIATLPPGTSTFTDTGLTHGNTYVYRVRAFNSFGNSAYAASMCVRNGATERSPLGPWWPTPQNPCGGTITP